MSNHNMLPKNMYDMTPLFRVDSKKVRKDSNIYDSFPSLERKDVSGQFT